MQRSAADRSGPVGRQAGPVVPRSPCLRSLAAWPPQVHRTLPWGSLLQPHGFPHSLQLDGRHSGSLAPGLRRRL